MKLFSTRRNPDAAQKQQILESASTIANVLLKHLEPMESGEYVRFFFFPKLSSVEDGTESLSISSCYTSLLGLVTTLMVDGKPS